MPAIGERCDAWGYSFTWNEHHQTREEYRKLKFTYDQLAEDCLNILESRYDGNGPDKPDLYALLDRHHTKDARLNEMWNQVTTVPDWVDWDQIKRGQDVFYRYGAANMTGLAYSSLIGGTGSSGDIAETLSRTGGFAIKVARKRLLETTQFVLQVTESLDSIKPGGAGFATTLRVRFLHARVRRKIMQLSSSRPSYYDVEKYGVPVNDADTINTIAAFSSILIWQALPRQGINLTEQETADFLALWRLVALYIGTPDAPYASPVSAKSVMETVLLHEFKPTATSRLLIRNMIRALENQPALYPSRRLIEASVWWLNGAPLSEHFGVDRPSLYYRILLQGQCMLFALMAQITRLTPAYDRWQIEAFKKTLWTLIMDEKHEGLGKMSMFDFKFLPAFGLLTQEEPDTAEKRAAVFWTADRKAFMMLATPLVMLGLFIYVTYSTASYVMRVL